MSEYPGSILGPTISLPYINDMPDDVVCDIAIYADDTTLNSKCHQVFDLWQQLKLASKLESDLRDTVDWGKKFSFEWSNNTGSTDVKVDGSVLGVTFSSKLDWGSQVAPIVKTASKKIEALICSMKFLSPEVALCLYKCTICQCMECCHAWAGAHSCYLELLNKLQKQI